ncbi:MAG TPA: hypothetical protein DEG71_08115 [Clostridiales bacterium]|nr:hypothetical protein [Clostridiales bacterium]
MMIQEFISLTNLSVSYDEYTNTIEPKYMTSTLDKQDFCKRYININTTNIKPLAKELKEIKEAIKDFKGNRSFAKREEKKILENHKEKLKEYNSQNWVDRNFIKTLEYNLNVSIYKLYEMYGNDATIQIIYNDGTECNVTGTEIVTGEITPKLQQIAYASYQDGYIIYDTLSGNLDTKWDIEIEGEKETDWDAREEYFDQVEIKFGTKWGIKHNNTPI